VPDNRGLDHRAGTNLAGLLHVRSDTARAGPDFLPTSAQERAIDMQFSDLEKSALQLNALYEQLEARKYGRVWTTEELALGFVGDVGDLARLIQAHAGVRDIDDCAAKLGHELSDCLWSIIVLANKCGIDLQAEFARNISALSEHVSGQLGK